MSLLQAICEDTQAAFERDPAAETVLDIVLYSVGTHAVWRHRWHHWLYERGLRHLALWLSKRMRCRLGVDIHPAATIGRRLVIDHGMGIVIGETAIVGNDCKIFHGVTLGGTGKERGKRHPTLGNGVMVGSGAKVLGNVSIGDNAKIGANAVVLWDVPANTTAVGMPARLVVHHRG